MVGDRCHHWGEESRKKSTVVGDQRDKQEWKRWTAPRQRHSSPGNLTNGDYLTQTLRNTHCEKQIHLLTNSDYKLLAKCLALRLSSVTGEIMRIKLDK